MNGLFIFLQGISVWLMSIVGWVFDFITLHGFADWFRSPGVVFFLTNFLAALVVFIVGFLISITFIWEERKILGRLMDRRGTQVGVLGLFQNFADGLKAFIKEIIIPDEVDKWIYDAAPVILIALRMLQGLALGGEYGGAATYVAEHSPHGKRGAYTSWIQTTATLGLMLSLMVILGTQTLLGAAMLVNEAEQGGKRGIHPAQLKDMVASPGGTTIEGLHELEKGRMRGTLISAVRAAAEKSKKLGQG